MTHSDRYPRTAFVLSGGGSLGAVQAGMLAALYERDIVPDLLVATSAGALNAAYVASRPQTVATAEDLGRVWRGLHRDDVFPVRMQTVLGAVRRHGDHLVEDHGVRHLAMRHLQIQRLEQAAVPLHLVAFDLAAGEEVLLSEGPALEAVLAATAIPGVLPAVKRGEQLLVDGAVANNTPISHAVELGAERIYVLPAQASGRALGSSTRGAFDVALHAMMLLVGARLAVDVERYAGEVELNVLPRLDTGSIQASDFGHAARLIRDGRTRARAALDHAGAGTSPGR